MEKFRAFFAIEIEEPARSSILKFLNECKGKFREKGIRWVSEDQLHITLKFLGNITEEAGKGFLRILEEKLKNFSPFTLSLKGTGFFPSEKAPRVFWIGVDKGRGKLMEMNRLIEEISPQFAIPQEKREFNPHLTLSRIKERSAGLNLSAALAPSKERDFGETHVHSLILFKSILLKEGAKYIKLNTLSFRGGENG